MACFPVSRRAPFPPFLPLCSFLHVHIHHQPWSLRWTVFRSHKDNPFRLLLPSPLLPPLSLLSHLVSWPLSHTPCQISHPLPPSVHSNLHSRTVTTLQPTHSNNVFVKIVYRVLLFAYIIRTYAQTDYCVGPNILCYIDPLSISVNISCLHSFSSQHRPEISRPLPLSLSPG